jgi:hypothetical protein
VSSGRAPVVGNCGGSRPNSEPTRPGTPIRKNIEVKYESQLRNFQTTHAHWACILILRTQDATGREQEIAVFPIDLIRMRLVQINLGRPAPELREKIKRYQVEAADVLARHFTGAEPAAPEGDDDPLMVQARLMVALLERQRETRRLALDANVIASEAKTTANAALATVIGDSGSMAIVGWNRLNDLGMSTPQISSLARRLAG